MTENLAGRCVLKAVNVSKCICCWGCASDSAQRNYLGSLQHSCRPLS